MSYRSTMVRLTAAAAIVALPACGGGDDVSTMDTTAGAATQTPPPAGVEADERDDVVERAFDADSTLRAYGLDVDDDDNRLVLKGTVRTAAERDAAAQVAARAGAGLAVDNRIRVDANRRVSAQPRDVDDIEDQVEDAIEADSSLRDLDIDVDEEDGQIVIAGAVNTAAQQSAVEALAKRLAGTVTVVNRLKVEP